MTPRGARCSAPVPSGWMTPVPSGTPTWSSSAGRCTASRSRACIADSPAARRIAVGVTVIDPADPAVTGFDVVLARDHGPSTSVRDLATAAVASARPVVPVTGVILTCGQGEYGNRRRHEAVTSQITGWLSLKACAPVPLETRLDIRDWRLCATAEAFMSLLARLDIVVTTRLHGLALALSAGVPPRRRPGGRRRQGDGAGPGLGLARHGACRAGRRSSAPRCPVGLVPVRGRPPGGPGLVRAARSRPAVPDGRPGCRHGTAVRCQTLPVNGRDRPIRSGGTSAAGIAAWGLAGMVTRAAGSRRAITTPRCGGKGQLVTRPPARHAGDGPVPLKRRGEYLRTGLRFKLRYLAVQRAVRVIVPTNAVADDAINVLGLPAERIVVIGEAAAPALVARVRRRGRGRARALRAARAATSCGSAGMRTPDPRKRVAALARAERSMPLVLVGPSARWATELPGVTLTGDGHRRRAGRDLHRRPRARVPQRRRGLRAAAGRGAGVRDAGGGVRRAGTARGARRSRAALRASATSTG